MNAISTWISAHKALIASIGTALMAASGAVPPPYNAYIYAAAIVLAALSGGIKPVAPPPAS